GGERGEEPGEAGLDEGDAPGSADQQRHDLEAVDGDLDAGLDAQHAELAHGRGVVGALVGDPGQPGQVFPGQPVVDARVVVGEQEDRPVLVDVGGGVVADDAVRNEQAVGGAQQGVRGVNLGGRRLGDAQPDAGGFLRHDPGEFGAEDGDRVVGRHELELTALFGRVEVRLAGEETFQQVVGGGRAVDEDLPEGGEFVVAADTGQQVVVEVPAQAGECRTHRRLAEADALSGAGDVALFEESAQGDDEVEVQATEIHGDFSRCSVMTCGNLTHG